MGRVKFYILSLLAALSFSCTKITTEFSSNVPSFQKLYGVDYEDEETVTIIEAYGGGYLAAGINEAVGDSASDICLMHLTPEGNLIENYIYGGFYYEDVHSIIKTSDGCYVLAGRSMSFSHTGSDVLVMKLSADLNVLWTKIFVGGSQDRALCIKELSDGNLIVAGATASYGAGSTELYLLKLSGSGGFLWARTFGGSGFDLAHSLALTDDGGFIITGWVSSSSNTQDIAVLKVSGEGSITWQKAYGGPGNELSFWIEPSGSNRFVISGSTDSYGSGATDALLLNINGNGNINWCRVYGGGLRDEARSVKRAFDGGYVIAGYTFSSGAGDGDVFFIKLNSQGFLQSANTYGESLFDIAYSIIASSDGGYLMPGSTVLPAYGKTDVRIIKTSGIGGSCGSRSFTSVSEDNYNISVTEMNLIVTSPQPIVLTPVLVRNTFPAKETGLCN
jgi:hypothetical protein